MDCSGAVVTHTDLPLRTAAVVPQLLGMSVINGPFLRVAFYQRELSHPELCLLCEGNLDSVTGHCKGASIRPPCLDLGQLQGASPAPELPVGLAEVSAAAS